MECFKTLNSRWKLRGLYPTECKLTPAGKGGFVDFPVTLSTGKLFQGLFQLKRIKNVFILNIFPWYNPPFYVILILIPTL